MMNTSRLDMMQAFIIRLKIYGIITVKRKSHMMNKMSGGGTLSRDQRMKYPRRCRTSRRDIKANTQLEGSISIALVHPQPILGQTMITIVYIGCITLRQTSTLQPPKQRVPVNQRH